MRPTPGFKSLQFIEALGKNQIFFSRSYKSRRHMEIVLFAGRIEARLLSSGANLGTQPVAVTSMHQAMIFPTSKGQYIVETYKSLLIHLLFERLFDLIICRATKMGLLVPSAAEGSTLDLSVETDKSQLINLLFVALFNLIICHTTTSLGRGECLFPPQLKEAPRFHSHREDSQDQG